MSLADSAPPSYRRSQPFLPMWLLLPLPVLLAAVSAVERRDAASLEALAVTAVVCAVGLLGLGRLTIELRGDILAWSFGYLGWPRWQLPLAQVVQVDVGRPSLWRGAGIKGLLGKDRLYTVAVGGPALRLTLTDGRSVTLGTPEPDRLEAQLRARMAAR